MESFSCSKVNGFSTTCKQTSGFARDYLTAEQTTSNRNRYRLNRVLVKILNVCSVFVGDFTGKYCSLLFWQFPVFLATFIN